MVRWLSGGLVPFRMVVCSVKSGVVSSGRILASISWNFQEPTLPDEFHFWIFPEKSAANVSEKGRQHETGRKNPGNMLGSFPTAENRPKRPCSDRLHGRWDAKGCQSAKLRKVGLDVQTEFIWIYGVYLVYLVGPISLGFGNGSILFYVV